MPVTFQDFSESGLITDSNYLIGYSDTLLGGEKKWRFDTIVNSLSEKVRFTAAGNVGINESSPEGKLHVTAGSAGSVTAQPSSVGVFESSGHAYLSLLSPTSKYAGVVMGGPTNPYGSYVSWNHDNLALKVATNHAGASIQMLAGTEQEALRITSSGNVGIGTTSPSQKLTVSGNILTNGLLIPTTVNVTPSANTTLLSSNDITFNDHTTSVTITSFDNGVAGVTYTLTNLGTNTVEISSTSRIYIRGTTTSLSLTQYSSCSLRMNDSTVGFVW